MSDGFSAAPLIPFTSITRETGMDENEHEQGATDPIADAVNQWIQDTFHGSRMGRELSDRSQGEILAAKDALIGKLRALPR